MFTCVECGRQYPYPSDFVWHVRQHVCEFMEHPENAKSEQMRSMLRSIRLNILLDVRSWPGMEV